jgi:hypothetical protein
MITLFGCEKEPKIVISRHPNQEIDIDNDSFNDFVIHYDAYTWDGIGPNGTCDGVSGSIIPLDNTLFLKADSGYFYNESSKIMYNTSDLSWQNTRFWAVKIESSFNGFSQPWKINSPEASKYYYVVFKKTNGDTIYLAG